MSDLSQTARRRSCRGFAGASFSNHSYIEPMIVGRHLIQDYRSVEFIKLKILVMTAKEQQHSIQSICPWSTLLQYQNLYSTLKALAPP